MVSPWITLGLLLGFAVIWAWLARQLTPTRLMDLDTRGLRQLRLGKHDAARDIFTALLSETRDHKPRRDLAISALTFLAAIHEMKDERVEAAAAWKLAEAERASAATRLDAVIAKQLADLARRQAVAGKWPAAESLSARALELAELSPDAGEGALVSCMQTRAAAYLRQNQPQQAIPLLERAWSIAANFGPDDPRPVQVQCDLATALWRNTEFDRAAGLFDLAIESLERVVSQNEFVPDALVSIHRMRGELASDLGQHEKALKHYQRAVKLCEMTGEEDKTLAFSLTRRGDCRIRLGDYHNAEADLKRAIELFTNEQGADAPGLLFAQAVYASLQGKMGRQEKAIRLAAHVLAVTETPTQPIPVPTDAEAASAAAAADEEQIEDAATPAPPSVADPPFNQLAALTVLARANFELGRLETAESFARRAVATAQSHLPATGRSLARNLHRLALIRAQLGDIDAARDFFQQAIAAYEAREDRSELNEVIEDRDRLLGSWRQESAQPQ